MFDNDNEKKYSCNNCNLYFTLKHNLVRHIKKNICKKESIIDNEFINNSLIEENKSNQEELNVEMEKQEILSKQKEDEMKRQEILIKQQEILINQEQEILLKQKEDEIKNQLHKELKKVFEVKEEEEQNIENKNLLLEELEQVFKLKKEEEIAREMEQTENMKKHEQEKLKQLKKMCFYQEKEEELKQKIKQLEEEIRQEKNNEVLKIQMEEIKRQQTENNKQIKNIINDNLIFKINKYNKELNDDAKTLMDRLNKINRLVDIYNKLKKHEIKEIDEYFVKNQKKYDDDCRYRIAFNNIRNIQIELKTAFFNETINDFKKEYTEIIDDKKNIVLLKNQLIVLSNYIKQNNTTEKNNTYQDAMLLFNKIKKQLDMNYIKNKSYKIKHKNIKNKTAKYFMKKK